MGEWQCLVLYALTEEAQTATSIASRVGIPDVFCQA